MKLKAEKSPFSAKVKDEAVTTCSSRHWWRKSNSPNGRQAVRCGIPSISAFEPINGLKTLRASEKDRTADGQTQLNTCDSRKQSAQKNDLTL